MGVAEVYGLHVIYNDVETDSGYDWADSEHESWEAAEAYAREWAVDYLAWLDEQCDCEGSCGSSTDHGYSIQYCRDGYTTDCFG